jgi:hypothetical protein
MSEGRNTWSVTASDEFFRSGLAELGSDRWVLMMILARAARTGPSCYLGNPELARQLGCDERTIKRLLNQLETDGWIARVMGPRKSRLGIILRRRPDPSNGVADTPESLAAAIDQLSRDRRRGVEIAFILTPAVPRPRERTPSRPSSPEGQECPSQRDAGVPPEGRGCPTGDDISVTPEGRGCPSQRDAGVPPRGTRVSHVSITHLNQNELSNSNSRGEPPQEFQTSDGGTGGPAPSPTSDNPLPSNRKGSTFWHDTLPRLRHWMLAAYRATLSGLTLEDIERDTEGKHPAFERMYDLLYTYGEWAIEEGIKDCYKARADGRVRSPHVGFLAKVLRDDVDYVVVKRDADGRRMDDPKRPHPETLRQEAEQAANRAASEAEDSRKYQAKLGEDRLVVAAWRRSRAEKEVIAARDASLSTIPTDPHGPHKGRCLEPTEEIIQLRIKVARSHSPLEKVQATAAMRRAEREHIASTVPETDLCDDRPRLPIDATSGSSHIGQIVPDDISQAEVDALQVNETEDVREKIVRNIC